MQMEGELKELRGENIGLRQQCTDLSNQVDDLRQSSEEKQNQSREECEKLLKEKTIAETSVKALEEQRSDLKDRLRQKDKDIRELESSKVTCRCIVWKNIQFEVKAEEQIKAVKAEMQQLRSQNGENSDLLQKLQEITYAKDRLSVEKESLTSSLAEVKGRLSASEERVNGLSQDLQAKEEENGRLNAEIKIAQRESETARHELQRNRVGTIS